MPGIYGVNESILEKKKKLKLEKVVGIDSIPNQY